MVTAAMRRDANVSGGGTGGTAGARGMGGRELHVRGRGGTARLRGEHHPCVPRSATSRGSARNRVTRWLESNHNVTGIKAGTLAADASFVRARGARPVRRGGGGTAGAAGAAGRE